MKRWSRQNWMMDMFKRDMFIKQQTVLMTRVLDGVTKHDHILDGQADKANNAFSFTMFYYKYQYDNLTTNCYHKRWDHVKIALYVTRQMCSPNDLVTWFCYQIATIYSILCAFAICTMYFCLYHNLHGAGAAIMSRKARFITPRHVFCDAPHCDCNRNMYTWNY